jgi:tetratricopeptide (TPR) repeat protein
MEQLLQEKILFSNMANPACLREMVLSMESTTVSKSRQKAHWEAKVLMVEKNYLEAIAALSVAIMKFGPHVALRIDLATCYYNVGMAARFDSLVKEIQADYLTFQPLLHPISKVRSALFVGQLLEEVGFLQASYDLYEKTRPMLEEEFVNPIWFFESQRLFLRLTAQVLRFYVQYEFLDEAKKLYSVLIRAQTRNTFSLYTVGDVYHACYLYHSRLASDPGEFSMESVRATEVSDSIKNLCFYESVELALRFNQRHPKDFEKFPPDNDYDRILKSMFQEDEIQSSAFIYKAISTLSKASLIRALLLHRARFGERSPVDLHNLLNSIMAGLSTPDQSLWRRWAQTSRTPQTESLSLGPDWVILKTPIQTQKIDLSRRPAIYGFLKAISTKEEFEWEELATMIWGNRPELSDFDRLRMLVSRVNKLLHFGRNLFIFGNSVVQRKILIQMEDQ